MGKKNWKLEKYLELINNEVEARDNCVIERNVTKSSLNNRERSQSIYDRNTSEYDTK